MKDIRCKIGLHKPSTYNVIYSQNIFGGPHATYYWKCVRCGKPGVT